MLGEKKITVVTRMVFDFRAATLSHNRTSATYQRNCESAPERLKPNPKFRIGLLR